MIGHWQHLLPGDAPTERFLAHTVDTKSYEPVVRPCPMAPFPYCATPRRCRRIFTASSLMSWA